MCALLPPAAVARVPPRPLPGALPCEMWVRHAVRGCAPHASPFRLQMLLTDALRSNRRTCQASPQLVTVRTPTSCWRARPLRAHPPSKHPPPPHSSSTPFPPYHPAPGTLPAGMPCVKGLYLRLHSASRWFLCVRKPRVGEHSSPRQSWLQTCALPPPAGTRDPPHTHPAPPPRPDTPPPPPPNPSSAQLSTRHPSWRATM